jgi:peptidoglycan/xylan/chitin deacetylase (PgdA/CDA1 family)
VKRVAKKLLGHSLVRTGLWDQKLRSWARQRTTLILTYHRVIEKWDDTLDYSQPGMMVTAANFEHQLAALRNDFDMVPLDALVVDPSIDTPGRRPRCAITLDDGWRDNYDLALPILTKLRIPATVFLTTDFIGTDRTFWHTRLMYLLIHGDPSRLLGGGFETRDYPADVRDALGRLARLGKPLVARDLDRLIDIVKTAFDEDTIERLVAAVGRALGISVPPDRTFFLDWTQVREMAAAGVSIGSHGCSHRIMTRLSLEDAGAEMARSKAEIERRVGRPVQHFAFPNEAASPALLTAAERAGYRTVCASGLAAESSAREIRLLPRLGMHEGVCGDGHSFDESLLYYWLRKVGRR